MKSSGNFTEESFSAVGVNHYPFVQLYEWMDFFEIFTATVSVKRDKLGLTTIIARKEQNDD